MKRAPGIRVVLGQDAPNGEGSYAHRPGCREIWGQRRHASLLRASGTAPPYQAQCQRYPRVRRGGLRAYLVREVYAGGDTAEAGRAIPSRNARAAERLRHIRAGIGKLDYKISRYDTKNASKADRPLSPCMLMREHLIWGTCPSEGFVLFAQIPSNAPPASRSPAIPSTL